MVKPVLRWCKNCGQRKPLKDFDQVGDSLRRFCSHECRKEWEEKGPQGGHKPRVWFP